MSVILVKKYNNKIVIGSDSQETAGQTYQINFKDSKLRKIEDNIYLAVAGDLHVCSLLFSYSEKNSLSEINSAMDLVEYFIKFNNWLLENIYTNPSEEETVLERCQFLIVTNNRVWQFTNFYVREIFENEHNSIGSGCQIASACMMLTDSVEKALRTVCNVDIYCSLPIKIIEIDTTEE